MQVKSNGLTTMQRTEDVVGLDLKAGETKWCAHRRQEVQATWGQLEVEGWKGTYRRTWTANSRQKG